MTDVTTILAALPFLGILLRIERLLTKITTKMDLCKACPQTEVKKK